MRPGQAFLFRKAEGNVGTQCISTQGIDREGFQPWVNSALPVDLRVTNDLPGRGRTAHVGGAPGAA